MTNWRGVSQHSCWLSPQWSGGAKCQHDLAPRLLGQLDVDEHKGEVGLETGQQRLADDARRPELQPALHLPRQTLYPRRPDLVYYAIVPPQP